MCLTAKWAEEWVGSSFQVPTGSPVALVVISVVGMRLLCEGSRGSGAGETVDPSIVEDSSTYVDHSPYPPQQPGTSRARVPP